LFENKSAESKTTAKKKVHKDKSVRSVKKSTVQTMPYECFVSNYVCLLKTGVRINKETTNLYSKTYLVPDTNYSALTKKEQHAMMLSYIEMLNGFDSATNLQITLLNTKMNKEDFQDKVLLKRQNDGLNEHRDEFNEILRKRVMQGQNGIECRKFITVTVQAINIEIADSRFFNIEAHLSSCLESMGTGLIVLNANQRVRLMANILRSPDEDIFEISRDEFARRSEKTLCCPDYFEFKKDYFMFNDKFAKCLYFKKLPNSIQDTILKDIIETNLSLIVTENIEFVEPANFAVLLRQTCHQT